MSPATLTDADVRVRDAVLEQLEWDPRVNASAVGVTASGGTVTLTGFIDSCAGKLAAERAAKRVSGVRAVANDIEVRRKLERADADIAADVTSALEESHTVPASVQASVHNGRVTLTGTVEGVFQKDAAEQVVRHLHGVRSVADYIFVAPRATADTAGVARVDHRVEPPDEMC
jgi:osmotically-inducible protein OsmY